MDLTYVHARQIQRGKNDRQSFDQTTLLELANSIGEYGLAMPPLLRPVPNGNYEIVAGERRIRAMCDILKWEEIPARISPMTDEEASAFMLMENTSREDLLPMEESDAYQYRIDKYGWGVKQLATASGTSEYRVRSRLRLQKLSPYIKELVSGKTLPVRYADKMWKLDHNRQYLALLVWKEKPNMRLNAWQNVLGQFYQEQVSETQQHFLELVAQQKEYVEKIEAKHIKGEHAKTGVKCTPTLLPPAPAKGSTRQEVIESYVAWCRDKHYVEAAGAISNLFNDLCALGLLKLERPVRFDDPGARTSGKELALAREKNYGK